MWRIVIWPGSATIFFYQTIEIPDDGGDDDDNIPVCIPPLDRWVVSERKPGGLNNPCEGVEPAPFLSFNNDHS